MDVSGKLVQILYSGRIASGPNTFTFSSEPLQSGTYMVRIVGPSGTVAGTKRIVKN
jgi:hypothetical protein